MSIKTFGPEAILAYQAAQDRWDLLFDKMLHHCKLRAPQLGLNTHYLKSILMALFKEPLKMSKGIPPEDLEALKTALFPSFDSQPWTEAELKRVYQQAKKSEQDMSTLIKNHFAQEIRFTLHKVKTNIPDEVFQNERGYLYAKALEFILKNLKTYQVHHETQAQFWTYIQSHLRKQLTADAYAIQSQIPQNLQKHVPLLLKLRHLDPDLIAEIMALKTQQQWSLEKVTQLLSHLQQQKQSLSLDASLFDGQGNAHELIADNNEANTDPSIEDRPFIDTLQERLSPLEFQNMQQDLQDLDQAASLDPDARANQNLALKQLIQSKLKDSAEFRQWLEELA